MTIKDKGNVISVEEAKKISEEHNLKPGVVKGTDILQFTKGNSENIEVINWKDFKSILNRKELKIYEYNGWMKIQ